MWMKPFRYTAGTRTAICGFMKSADFGFTLPPGLAKIKDLLQFVGEMDESSAKPRGATGTRCLI